MFSVKMCNVLLLFLRHISYWRITMSEWKPITTHCYVYLLCIYMLFFVNILFFYLFSIQLWACLANSFSCTFCILSCCNKCISSLCPGVSLWFSSGDCPHGNKKTFWQPVTIQCYTLTLFSCPTGRRMTVPVTLMTDSTVRLHSTAFKWLADLKQKEIC